MQGNVSVQRSLLDSALLYYKQILPSATEEWSRNFRRNGVTEIYYQDLFDPIMVS